MTKQNIKYDFYGMPWVLCQEHSVKKGMTAFRGNKEQTDEECESCRAERIMENTKNGILSVG